VSQNERVLERRPLEDRKGADGEETERRRKKRRRNIENLLTDEVTA
jgi:hypothetical protein